MRIRLNLAALALAVVCPAQATVTSAYAPSTYSCNGSTTAYTIGFKYLAQGDLLATSTTAAGVVTTLALTTDYTVSPTLGGATGTLTLVAGSRCPSGSTLKIARSMALTQPTGFRAQGPYSATSHETAYDRDVLMLQQVQAGQIASVSGDVASATYSVNGSGTRAVGAKLKETCAVTDYAAGADDSGRFATAITNCKKVTVPAGAYSFGTTSVSLGQGTSLVGDSMSGTVINYSGTGCAFIADSVSDGAVERMTINTLGNNANKRAICPRNTTGPFKRWTFRDLLIQGDPSFPQLGYGIYPNATTLNSMYWLEIQHVNFNFFDRGVRLEGCTVAGCGGTGNGPNATFITDINSTAENYGVEAITMTADVITKGIHCQASGLLTAQTCFQVGDGVNPVTNIQIYGIVSDQGTLGQGVAIASLAANTIVMGGTEGSVAITDAGTNSFIYDSLKDCCGNIYRMRVPSLQVIGAGNVSGRLTLGGGFATTRRAVADTIATMATTDYGLYYTSISATRIVTLESAGAGTQSQHEICDESGSAAAGVKIQVLAPAGQAVNGTANPTPVDCVAAAYGCCHVRSAGGTAWFKW